MVTEDKVTEIFFMADDFCKFFDTMIKSSKKRIYNRESTMSKAEVMLIMIPAIVAWNISIWIKYVSIYAICSLK